jgi:hypothetical protein
VNICKMSEVLVFYLCSMRTLLVLCVQSVFWQWYITWLMNHVSPANMKHSVFDHYICHFCSGLHVGNKMVKGNRSGKILCDN